LQWQNSTVQLSKGEGDFGISHETLYLTHTEKKAYIAGHWTTIDHVTPYLICHDNRRINIFLKWANLA
jgi:hypothetical protein